MTENVVQEAKIVEARKEPRVTVWVADGKPTLDLDYGTRLAEQFSAFGFDVECSSLTDLADDVDISTDVHVLTGGATSVYDHETWMTVGLKHVQKLMDATTDSRTHLLGVCLGSQMIAETLSKGAIVSSEYIEAGMVPVTWNNNQETIYVPSFHYEQIDFDAVASAGAEIIAGNSHSPVHAYSVGERILGMQFHSEFSLLDTKQLLVYNEEIITEFGGNMDQINENMKSREGFHHQDAFKRTLIASGFGQLTDADAFSVMAK